MENQDGPSEISPVSPKPTPSTLIEFPGSGRAARPLWRKELSERVREIQERRAKEAASEARERQLHHKTLPVDFPGATPLGLVPQRDQPVLNPLVAAALKRIERAQQNPISTHGRSGARGASAAAARIVDEDFEIGTAVDSLSLLSQDSEVTQDKLAGESQKESRRAHSLSVVQNKIEIAEPTFQTSLLRPGLTNTLASPDVGTLAPGEFYDDYAPLYHRFVAGLIDFFVVLFASSPFAAIIELTNGDWTDERVLASMGAIFLIVMFLYLTTSTSVGGRTWGMSLLSLRAVDVDSGLPPTNKQSGTRAFFYMLSLLTFGLGVLYAAVDAEGRGVHDHLSGTTVVRE